MKIALVFTLVFSFLMPFNAQAAAGKGGLFTLADACMRALDGRTYKESIYKLNQRAKEARGTGDPNNYYNLIVGRYSRLQLKHASKVYQKFHRLKQKIMSRLIIKNDNPMNLPALYLFDNNEAEEVFDKFLSGKPGEKDYEWAKKKIDGWIEYKEKQLTKIRKLVNKGFTALIQLEGLKDDIKGPNKLTFEDFVDDRGRVKPVKRKLTVWETYPHSRMKGEFISKAVEKEFTFTGDDDFYNYVDDLISAVKSVFAHNFYEQITRKSKVFDELYEQAKITNILKRLKRQLLKETRNGIQDHHRAYLSIIEKILDDEKYLPRADAEERLLNEELHREMRYVFTSNKKIRKNREKTKYNINFEAAAQLMNKSRLPVVATLARFSLYGLIFTSITSSIYWYAFEKGVLGELKAHVEAQVTEKVKDALENTASERTCAAEPREFSFDVCVPTETLKILAAELVEAREKDPKTERFSSLEKVTDRMYAHSVEMVGLRVESRNSELWTLSQKMLRENGYFGYAAKVLGEFVAKKFEDDVNIVTAVQSMFHYRVTDEERKALISVFKTESGIDLTKIADQYLKNKQEISDHIRHQKGPGILPANILKLIYTELEKQQPIKKEN